MRRINIAGIARVSVVSPMPAWSVANTHLPAIIDVRRFSFVPRDYHHHIGEPFMKAGGDDAVVNTGLLKLA